MYIAPIYKKALNTILKTTGLHLRLTLHARYAHLGSLSLANINSLKSDAW